MLSDLAYGYGRYLVVTTGKRRIKNMKAQAERSGGKGLFYFSTFDKVRPETVLTEPIWMLAGHQEATQYYPSMIAKCCRLISLIRRC